MSRTDLFFVGIGTLLIVAGMWFVLIASLLPSGELAEAADALLARRFMGAGLVAVLWGSRDNVWELRG